MLCVLKLILHELLVLLLQLLMEVREVVGLCLQVFSFWKGRVLTEGFVELSHIFSLTILPGEKGCFLIDTFSTPLLQLFQLLLWKLDFFNQYLNVYPTILHLADVALQLPIDCGQSLQIGKDFLCDFVEEVMRVKIDAVICCQKGVETFSELFEYIIASKLFQV